MFKIVITQNGIINMTGNINVETMKVILNSRCIESFSFDLAANIPIETMIFIAQNRGRNTFIKVHPNTPKKHIIAVAQNIKTGKFIR